ncbi:MAG: peptidoglycan DD-metalloendopeptidase family protein [Oscillochloridaceae bacterium umkhey_bin13]
MRRVLLLCLLVVLVATLLPTQPSMAAPLGPGTVQTFLNQQPGPLKQFSDEGRSAAAIIEAAADYYGLSPQITLALLEATSELLSNANPGEAALFRPFGTVGPPGFSAQIDWATRELRAGLGPYERPPTVRFSDGLTTTLSLDQAPEGVAVQRLLAQGRTAVAWHAAVERFTVAFAELFANQLIRPGAPEANHPVPANPTQGFLFQPWPAGTRVVHLAYFDHMYPMVDSGGDGNGYVVNYLGQGNVQYDGHDGHDYYFPDQPIGTPILAAAAGTAYARTHRGLGVVIVHPDGYETVYWHLDGFAPIFTGLIDSGQGVRVQAGDFIGTSGTTGFVRGTPHLHFEVRRYGRQVDPYGWYGPGPDPCPAYIGCLASTWLWHPSLIGSYNFTPPDLVWAGERRTSLQDTTPPVGTLTVNPPEDVLLALDFDGHVVPSIGSGFPILDGSPRLVEGRVGQALMLGPAGLTYPVAGNLEAQAGTLSLWAKPPKSYPSGRIPRHYVLAASANPAGAPVYSHTLALRRDMVGPDGNGPAWVFWTTAADEASRDLLSVPDTLGSDWNHLALTWDVATGAKAIYLNGVLMAEAIGLRLPSELGEVIQFGRFTYGGGHSGITIDQFRSYARVLTPTEIAELAQLQPSDEPAVPVVQRGQPVVIETNAIDDQGGIVAVQLGLNGTFEAPQPYYDRYRWILPTELGTHELAVRYMDRAGNVTTVTQTVEVVIPPLERRFLPLVRR